MNGERCALVKRSQSVQAKMGALSASIGACSALCLS